VDAASALADLTEISSQIEAAVLVDAEGGVLASTVADAAAGERLARTGLELLETAGADVAGGRTVTRLEVALREGSVFVVRDGELAIVARTSPRPASGLVLYDLGACLQTVAASRSKPKRRRRPSKKAEPADA
jgi:predicted regulator of Ras-like GTPase activity (Roadblock/LC7/MglB family)